MNEESKFPKHQRGHGDGRIPHDLWVMAVDSDRVVLKILVAMLRKCQYQVTGETEAKKALDMLRRNPEKYDIVITDVVRDDMDGFKILETIGLEMDIPVIMLSASDDKDNIMRAIKHGARDYISKPVRVEVLRNIWQHVFRKRLSDNLASADNQKLGSSIETTNLAVAGKEPTTYSQCNGNASGARKKARLTWLPELHKRFIDAVKSLGMKEAVPKKILEVINEPGITRENVASHLQKYRKMLKKQELEKSENEARRAQIGCSRINMQPMKTSKVESCGGSGTASSFGPFVTGTGNSIDPFSTAYTAGHARYAQMLSYNSLNNHVQHSNWFRSATMLSPNFPTLTDLTTMSNLKPQAFSTSQLGPQNRSYNHLGSTPLLGIDHPNGSCHSPMGYHHSNNQHRPLLTQGNAFPPVSDPAMESIVLTPLPKSSSGEECEPTMPSSANTEGTIYESSSGANELLEGILGSSFYKNKQSSSDDNLNAILNQFTSDGVPRLH